MGTIEKTTPAVAEAEASAVADAESVAEAEPVALAEEAESMALTMSEAMTDMADMIIEVASGGVTVVVEEDEDAEDDELPLAWRKRLDVESGVELMKAMVGPATIALLWRSTAPPFSGWPSDVIQIATGPLMPWGTTHWPIGSGMEKGRPPASIWQKKPCGWTPTHM